MTERKVKQEKMEAIKEALKVQPGAGGLCYSPEHKIWFTVGDALAIIHDLELAEAKVERLREALKPFAHPISYKSCVTEERCGSCDVCKAQAALEEPKP